MKYLIITLAAICLPLFSFGQDKVIQNFYNKYKAKEDVSHIRLQGWVLKLASKFSDDKDAGELIRKVTQLRVMSMDNGNLVTKSEYNRLLKEVRSRKFEDLMNVRSEGDHIQLMIRENKDAVITDVLLLVNGIDNFVMISLEGALRFSDLNDLDIDIDGADQFKKLPDDRKALRKA